MSIENRSTLRQSQRRGCFLLCSEILKEVHTMKTNEQTLRYQKEIDKLNQQLAEIEARQKKAADDAKILRRKVQTAQRNMRTHRLCVLGALLEKHLREPDLLTTDDADRILSSIFADPSIQERLTNALVFRRANPANDKVDSNADES